MLGWGANGAKLPTVGLWLKPLNRNPAQAEQYGIGCALEPGWPRRACPPPSPPPLFQGPVRRALPPGTPRARKGGRPLALHAPHIRGEPGAKPLVDDLLLGRGVVGSRAAPSLPSIESLPSDTRVCGQITGASASASVLPVNIHLPNCFKSWLLGVVHLSKAITSTLCLPAASPA